MTADVSLHSFLISRSADLSCQWSGTASAPPTAGGIFMTNLQHKIKICSDPSTMKDSLITAIKKKTYPEAPGELSITEEKNGQ